MSVAKAACRSTAAKAFGSMLFLAAVESALTSAAMAIGMGNEFSNLRAL